MLVRPVVSEGVEELSSGSGQAILWAPLYADDFRIQS